MQTHLPGNLATSSAGDTWPDPFSRWDSPHADTPLAHQRVPHWVEPSRRNSAVDAVLSHLMLVALDPGLDANRRCACYTLAAALLACPSDVTLSVMPSDIPDFLRPPQNRGTGPSPESPLTPAHIELLRCHPQDNPSGYCGTCGARFPSEWLSIKLQYQNLVCTLDMPFHQHYALTLCSRNHPDLAILDADHTNNLFAHGIMDSFSEQNTSDHARLTLLAFGLDGLKRQLKTGHPWHEEIRKAL